MPHSSARFARRSSQVLGKIRNIKQQKRHKIYSHQPQIRKICEWIDNNSDKFRKKVFGPIGACIDAKNEDVAKYVDQHVANAVLQAFVVQTQADYDLLYSNIREKHKIPINIELVENGGRESNREYR